MVSESVYDSTHLYIVKLFFHSPSVDELQALVHGLRRNEFCKCENCLIDEDPSAIVQLYNPNVLKYGVMQVLIKLCGSFCLNQRQCLVAGSSLYLLPHSTKNNEFKKSSPNIHS